MSASPKQRKRRIASDEAHAWARNLRLGNAHAKFVLCMLTLYVNDAGVCFVSIPQLADDCELAAETIRRRLAWLEDIGAIGRRGQWIDESGRRNSEGRGRRTSDEIVLLLEADVEAIEARAKGEAPDADPIQQIGSDNGSADAPETISPPVGAPLALSLRTGPESSEPEPEPEDPPNPPQGGDQAVDEVLERDVSESQKLYPDPITDLPKFRSAMAALDAPTRQQVLTAMKGYAAFIADCERKRKPRGVKDAHRWVASGMWQGYLRPGENAEKTPEIQLVQIDSDAGKAWLALHKIAGIGEPVPMGGQLRVRTPTPRMLAFADLPPEPTWTFVAEADRNRVAAWRTFLGETLGKPTGMLIRDRSWRGSEKITERGFLAPWPWPPSKDGKIYDGQSSSETTMSEADEKFLAQGGL